MNTNKVARELHLIANQLASIGSKGRSRVARTLDSGCFFGKQELGNGIVTYWVADIDEGMEALRELIDEDWGEKANPWPCVARDSKGSMEKAEKEWKRIRSNVQKRIALKNGKLYMFFPGENTAEVEWYDKNNKKYYYLPGAFDAEGYRMVGWDDLVARVTDPEGNPSEEDIKEYNSFPEIDIKW